MTELKKALFAFWSQFGIPAYLDGCVPDDAVLPYIRYRFSRPSAMDVSLLTVFNHHRRDPSGNADRAEMADKIAKAICENGTKLPLDGGGFVVLYRNADFQSDYDDPNDPDVIGVRTSCEMYYYGM